MYLVQHKNILRFQKFCLNQLLESPKIWSYILNITYKYAKQKNIYIIDNLYLKSTVYIFVRPKLPPAIDDQNTT